MLGRINTFRHARCRLQRHGEPLPRGGWVERLGQDAARLRLNAFASFAANEPVRIECYGDGTCAFFDAHVVAQAGQELAVAIVGPLRFRPSSESMRLTIESVEGTIRGALEDVPLFVLDASLRSLGGVAGRYVGFDRQHMISLRTPGGAFDAGVRVANCRLADEGHWRVGLCMVRLSRLDAALWERTLLERAQD